MEVVLESIVGAVQIAGAFLGRPSRAVRARFGATPAEAERTFPGDELVPSPSWSYTHAIDVAATPERVWPWLVQIGQSRAGFYSYRGLENIAGCRIHNTTEIREEFQHLAIGDEVKLHPRAPGLAEDVVEHRRARDHRALIGTMPPIRVRDAIISHLVGASTSTRTAGGAPWDR